MDMASLFHKSYLLYFKEKMIGTIKTAHSGLGWVSGFFEPAPRFMEFSEFFRDLDDTEDFSSEVLPELERKYGKALLDPRNWTLKDTSGKKLNESLPFISGEVISWRGAC